jgi:hypothetical protein
MTLQHMSSAEFRRLYGDKAPTLTPDKARRPGRTVKGEYRTVCARCGEHLHSEPAQNRHQLATGHARYAIVIDGEPPVSPVQPRTPDVRTDGADDTETKESKP